jgi:Ribonuclease G/E
MTRQRMRPSLKKSIYQECRACRAHGMVKTPESMSLDVMRKLRIAAADQAVVRIMLTVHPDVATYMLNRKRAELAEAELKQLKGRASIEYLGDFAQAAEAAPAAAPAKAAAPATHIEKGVAGLK